MRSAKLPPTRGHPELVSGPTGVEMRGFLRDRICCSRTQYDTPVPMENWVLKQVQNDRVGGFSGSHALSGDHSAELSMLWVSC